jgi:hypothetical protein
MAITDVAGFGALIPSLSPVLSQAMSTDNCRVSERALLFWYATVRCVAIEGQPTIVYLYRENAHCCKLSLDPVNIKAMLTSVIGGVLREKNWNKTVNKMRCNRLLLSVWRVPFDDRLGFVV